MSKIKLIAIGVSMGGFEALEKVLGPMPADSPPIVIVMHLQPGIAKLFAAKIDRKFNISAKEAATGDILAPGKMFIAPAGLHMKIINRFGRLTIDCFLGEKEEFVMPAANVLFESVAAEVGKDAIGVILTGIGADGAKGLLKMRNAGATTLGQDEKSCAVYGMPKVAMEKGAVEIQMTPDEIAQKIISLL
ncbi:MAG: CheB methylesterase domain-containing protein [Defluviitaleaceae bacterium]|nr:CheB methylesterase domain-containing protein [Defluviitaleaceae bacterium]